MVINEEDETAEAHLADVCFEPISEVSLSGLVPRAIGSVAAKDGQSIRILYSSQKESFTCDFEIASLSEQL